jgi:tryptophan synthase alpha subunit
MDGPVIATCHEVARQQDVDLTQCLSDVMTAREKGLTVPVILMGYSRPFVEYGWKRLASDAATAGVDGFLVPDCPSHEIDGVAAALAHHKLAFVPLVTPTTTKLDHTIDIARRTGGSMIYVISKPGKTGCSAAGVEEVAPRMDEVRRAAGSVPTTIGFGVSTPEHVRAFAPLADGVVVGSALIRALNEGRSPYERRTIARTFVGGLAAATHL